MYSDVSLFIDGSWGPAAAGRTIDVVNPATGDKIGTVPHAAISDLDRALEAADKGFKTWRKISAYDRSKVMRKAADILRERAEKIATLMTMEQGKPRGRSQDGSAGRRRRDRLVRRGSPPRLRPRDPRPRRGRVSTGDQGAGRPGRRVHPVEFPDQPGGSETVGGAGRGLLDHRQGAGRNAGLACRTDPRLRRCRRAGRGDQPGLRRAVGNFRVSDSASGDSKDVVHRLDRGRQAIGGHRRGAHEAGDDGTGRPRAGHRVRRRRCRSRQPHARRRQIPQRRAGLRVADPDAGAGKGVSNNSSKASSPTRRS